MLTPEQLQNNLDLDKRIRDADLEFELYVQDCEIKRLEYYEAHPNTPDYIIKTMFIPILGKRFVGGIRYIDTP